MKQTVTKQNFVDAFAGTSYADNFTWEGREALFDYLEELEAAMGKELELDVVALCCEFSEYESALECVKEKNLQLDEYMEDVYDANRLSAEEFEGKCLECLRDNITVIEFETGIIIQDF